MGKARDVTRARSPVILRTPPLHRIVLFPRPLLGRTVDSDALEPLAAHLLDSRPQQGSLASCSTQEFHFSPGFRTSLERLATLRPSFQM